MTVLKYVEPAQMGSTEDSKVVTTTVQKYDLDQLKAAFKSQLMGVGMMGVMHLYFKYTNPLLVQSIIPLKGALEGNLAKVHLFGQPATGDLARPWKAGGGLMAGLTGQGGANEIKTDKASIEAAEKAGRGGKKDEVSGNRSCHDYNVLTSAVIIQNFSPRCAHHILVDRGVSLSLHSTLPGA